MKRRSQIVEEVAAAVVQRTQTAKEAAAREARMLARIIALEEKAGLTPDEADEIKRAEEKEAEAEGKAKARK